MATGSGGSNDSRQSGNLWLPWVTAIVAVLTLGATVIFHFVDQSKAGHERLLEHRRETLFSALQIVGYVFSNQPFNGQAPLHPHQFDLQLARDVENQIRIYCGDPQTIASFRLALGIYNPSVEQRKGVSVEYLEQFRRQIAKELELDQPIGSDPKLAWILSLDGAK